MPLRDNRDKDNKENNNNLNLPSQNIHKPPITESFLPLKPLLKHQSSLPSTQSSVDFPLQLKQTYSMMIAKDYSEEILTHISSSAPTQKDMLNNHNITSSLRSKMVDWMIEVLSSYKMSEETFFRGVYMMDAYMKKCPNKL